MLTVKGGPVSAGILQSVIFFCSRQTCITVSGVHNVMAQRVGIFGNGTALHNLQFSLPLFHTHTHSHAHTYFKQGGRKE